jgi:hypothetical protein
MRLVAGIAAALVILLLLWRLRRRQAPVKHPSRIQRPGDTDIFQMMERLGIPAESGRGGTHTAAAAKTRLFQHVRAIESGRWEEAVDGLRDTIELLEAQADARWNDVLGVAYRLRGRGHEGAGRRDEARDDYEKALVYLPDDAEAREGRSRLR